MVGAYFNYQVQLDEHGLITHWINHYWYSIIQDYVRAAMTCIKFYIGFTKRSTTIQDLHERRKYLQTAKQHFETSLESPQYRGRVFGRFSDDQSQASLPKTMKAQELQVEYHTHYCHTHFISVKSIKSNNNLLLKN